MMNLLLALFLLIVDDATEPVVFMFVPIESSAVPRTGPVLLEAAAGDDAELVEVRFYVDGKLECRDALAPYACDWTRKRKSGRNYIVEARAEDVAGNVSFSETVIYSTEEVFP